MRYFCVFQDVHLGRNSIKLLYASTHICTIVGTDLNINSANRKKPLTRIYHTFSKKLAAKRKIYFCIQIQCRVGTDKYKRKICEVTKKISVFELFRGNDFRFMKRSGIVYSVNSFWEVSNVLLYVKTF